MRHLLFPSLLLATLGCGTKPDLVPVRGRITLDGKAVAEVVVTFTPLGDTPGNGAMGATDLSGNFALTDVRGGTGTRVGEYRISLYPAPTGGTRPGEPADVVAKGSTSSVPGVYLDPNHSPLRATIPPSGGSVEVVLTRTGKGATTKTTPHTTP